VWKTKSAALMSFIQTSKNKYFRLISNLSHQADAVAEALQACQPTLSLRHATALTERMRGTEGNNTSTKTHTSQQEK